MYNLAALHTQKGYVKITVECVKTGSFQTALDSEAIDRAVESLLSAVDLFQTILSYVSYLYLDAAVLPELRYASLVFVRVCHWIYPSSETSVWRKPSISRRSSRVARDSSDLGPRPDVHGSETALRQCPGESLEGGSRQTRCSEHIKAMMELCYVQALFFHSYMTKEQLEDYTVHGTGRRLQLHLLLHGGDASVC